MAQLNDTKVNGNLTVTDHVITTGQLVSQRLQNPAVWLNESDTQRSAISIENATKQLYFHYLAGNTNHSYDEYYKLPAPDTTLTAGKTHNILTSEKLYVVPQLTSTWGTTSYGGQTLTNVFELSTSADGTMGGIKLRESPVSNNNSQLYLQIDGTVFVNEGMDEVIYSIASGTNQGQIKANGNAVSVTGLETSGTPQFSKVTATTFELTGINAWVNLANGGLKGTNANLNIEGSTGNITAATFNAKSDARLKENFIPLTPIKSILDLPTYKFDFINGAKNQIGCKAQDLQEICPEIVNEDSNGYLSIQESKIVYLLLDEVKKLRKEVDELGGG